MEKVFSISFLFLPLLSSSSSSAARASKKAKNASQTSFTFRTVARVGSRDCWIRFYLGMEFNEREISSRSNWYISDISRSVDKRQRDGFRWMGCSLRLTWQTSPRDELYFIAVAWQFVLYTEPFSL